VDFKTIFGSMYGMELYPSELMVDYKRKRARTHKKKRIDKKWLKRYGYISYTVASMTAYVMENKIIAHPDLIEKYKQAIKNGGK
jgi:hypothetical protein